MISFLSAGIPDASEIDFSNIGILIPVIMLALSIIIPCVVWFIRNLLRVGFKRNYDSLNRSIKWVWAIGLILFIVAIILLALKINGVY